MSGTTIVVLLTVGSVLFQLALALRVKTGGKYEIKMPDLALVLVPLVFWLIGTGKVQRFAFGGLEADFAQTFIGATEVSIEFQVEQASPLTIDDVVDIPERAMKGGVERIPRLIERETEALEFRLRHGGYWGPAIQKYFESLAGFAFLRYAIIHNSDGSLFGIYVTRDLVPYLREKGETAYQDFATYLNRGDQASLDALAGMPGFISGENSVSSESSKRSVLQEMEDAAMETLPVVDTVGRFVGVVERARLTASLIIDVAGKLEEPK